MTMKKNKYKESLKYTLPQQVFIYHNGKSETCGYLVVATQVSDSCKQHKQVNWKIEKIFSLILRM